MGNLGKAACAQARERTSARVRPGRRPRVSRVHRLCYCCLAPSRGASLSTVAQPKAHDHRRRLVLGRLPAIGHRRCSSGGRRARAVGAQQRGCRPLRDTRDVINGRAIRRGGGGEPHAPSEAARRDGQRRPVPASPERLSAHLSRGGPTNCDRTMAETREAWRPGPHEGKLFAISSARPKALPACDVVTRGVCGGAGTRRGVSCTVQVQVQVRVQRGEHARWR